MNGLLSYKWKLVIAGGVTVVAVAVFLAANSIDGRRSRTAERIASVPLELWSVAAVGAEGEVRGKATTVCTDSTVRQGFELPLPRINGEVCLVVGAPVRREGRFDARCQAAGQHYAVNLSRAGDVDADFTVRMRVQPIGNADPGAVQTLRYRKLGDCPAGWRAGQAAGADGGEAYDALDTRM